MTGRSTPCWTRCSSRRRLRTRRPPSTMHSAPTHRRPVRCCSGRATWGWTGGRSGRAGVAGRWWTTCATTRTAVSSSTSVRSRPGVSRRPWPKRCSPRLWDRRGERQPVLLVIDEAHNVCPQDPQDPVTAAATELAVRIAGEGRKYGIYLLVVTQRPQKVHQNVISQCDNLVLMRMNSRSDLALVREVFSFVPGALVDAATTFRQGRRSPPASSHRTPCCCASERERRRRAALTCPAHGRHQPAPYDDRDDGKGRAAHARRGSVPDDPRQLGHERRRSRRWPRTSGRRSTGIQTAITLYTLVMAMLMIPGGKVGSLIGRKRAFAIGCVIYGAGLAHHGARARTCRSCILGWSLLEGIGAALILPAIVALVASNVPLEGRPARVRPGHGGRRDRRRARPAHRRPRDDVLLLALGVRRRGGRRARDPRAGAQDRRRAGRGAASGSTSSAPSSRPPGSGSPSSASCARARGAGSCPSRAARRSSACRRPSC